MLMMQIIWQRGKLKVKTGLIDVCSKTSSCGIKKDKPFLPWTFLSQQQKNKNTHKNGESSFFPPPHECGVLSHFEQMTLWACRIK